MLLFSAYQPIFIIDIVFPFPKILELFFNTIILFGYNNDEHFLTLIAASISFAYNIEIS
jgi:hypothetical protein